EARIGYLELGETPWSTVAIHFFNPYHPLGGTTPGIRLEAAAACLLGAAYVFLRAPRGRIARAAGTAAAVYVTALAFFTLPVLYLRAVRSVLPGVSLTTLFHAAGRIPRPVDVGVRADQAILLYLVPMTLALAAIALAREDRERLRAVGRALTAPEGWGWAIAC